MSCPVERCLNSRDAGRLMCRKHWYQVPKQLRDEVWRTWKALTRPNRTDPRRAALDAYNEAAAEAVKSVTP